MSLLELAGIALVMAGGLIGVLVPFVPGLPVIWGAALFYGWVEGFGTVGWVAMVLITGLLVAGSVAKLVIPQRAASAGGALRSSILVAAVAGLVGFFVIPVVGLPLGAVAALYAMEYRRTGDGARAWRSTKAAIVGFGIGVLVELGAGMLMIASWAGWVLLD